MEEETKSKLKVSLIQALSKWWDGIGMTDEIPYLGEDTIAFIADAALAVINALMDTQNYLEREHGFKP